MKIKKTLVTLHSDPSVRGWGNDYRNRWISLSEIITVVIGWNELTQKDWDGTILVSSAGIAPRIKKISGTQKEELVKSGEQGALKYFYK